MATIDFDLGDEGHNGRVDGFFKQGSLSSLGCCLLTQMNDEIGDNFIIRKVVENHSNFIKFKAEMKRDNPNSLQWAYPINPQTFERPMSPFLTLWENIVEKEEMFNSQDEVESCTLHMVDTVSWLHRSPAYDEKEMVR